MAWRRLRTRRGKFGNIPTTVDGVRFGSRKEARRYQELKLRQKAGEISHLEYRKSHLRYPITINGYYIGYYEADFRYKEHGREVQEEIVEDTKGKRTDLYVWKKKLVYACYGIVIRET